MAALFEHDLFYGERVQKSNSCASNGCYEGRPENLGFAIVEIPYHLEDPEKIDRQNDSEELGGLARLFLSAFRGEHEELVRIFESELSDENRAQVLNGTLRDCRARTLVHLCTFVKNHESLAYLCNKNANLVTQANFRADDSFFRNSIQNKVNRSIFWQWHHGG